MITEHRVRRSMFLTNLCGLVALAGCGGGSSSLPLRAPTKEAASKSRLVRSSGSTSVYDANGNWMMTATKIDTYNFQLTFPSRPSMALDTRTFNSSGTTTIPTVGSFLTANGVVYGPEGGNVSISGTTMTYRDRFGNADSTSVANPGRSGGGGRQVLSWACALDILDLIFAYISFAAGCVTAETGIGVVGIIGGMYGMARAGEAAGTDCQ